jgi:hypothetical protein
VPPCFGTCKERLDEREPAGRPTAPFRKNEVPNFPTFQQPQVAPVKIMAPKGSLIVTCGVLLFLGGMVSKRAFKALQHSEVNRF